jgi:MarR family 2-MHQ and catechol resistance regulon transcriptional repressor
VGQGVQTFVLEKVYHRQMGSRYGGPEDQRLALDTFTKLHRCLNAIVNRIARECPLPEELTMSRFSLMEAVLHCGPLCQQDAARKVLRTPGNITAVVDQLEQEGLVERKQDPADRRRHLLHLTKRGRTLMEGYFPRHAECVARGMKVLSFEEQRALGSLCRKLGLAQAPPSQDGKTDG